MCARPRAQMPQESLLAVRAERAKTESNVLQLANRIKLLERAEKNARKRIEKARQRARAIEARREETEQARLRREAAAEKVAQRTLRLTTKLHVEKEQRSQEIERKLRDERERKRAMAITVKAQRARGEKVRAKAQRKAERSMRRRNLEVRSLRDLNKTKRDAGFDETTQLARERYNAKVVLERKARLKVEVKERKVKLR